ncbi:MAG: Helicase associated domain protein [Bacilli bacterium]|nr:Helicase associated domain protein [Bacilli bacterium]
MAIDLYPHNKKAYEAVKKMFKTKNKAAVIHPTGSGKTTIAIETMLDYAEGRILYLTSSYQILTKFSETVKSFGLGKNELPNLSGQIYSNLLSFEEKDFDTHFDLIILDEFHRCGAPEWNKGVAKLLAKNPDAKVLGLTATNVRFLDNERDMAYELFENSIASKMTLAEALLEEVLPIPTYVSLIDSYNKDIAELEERVAKIKVASTKEQALEKLKKIKRTVSSLPHVDQMLAKYITKKDGKLVVFCKDIAHLEEVKQNINNIFGQVNSNISVFEVDYKVNDPENVVKKFEEAEDDTLKVLLTIDMLNEGVHLKDLDGVVMLRRTISPIIFLQQLGRALSVTGKKNPLVIDVADNMRATESIYSLYTEFEQFSRMAEEQILLSDFSSEEKNIKLAKLKEQRAKFSVIDVMQETTDLITSLKKFVGFGFDEYYELLKVYYEVNGNIDVPSNYIVNGITLGRWIVKIRANKKAGNLTPNQIEMLDKLGMIWSKLEDSFIMGYNYAKKYYEENHNLLVPATYQIEEFGLGNFIRKQRSYYKAGKLSQERIKLLEDIGMVWDVREYEFNQGYKYALDYFKEHHNSDVPEGYTVDGFDLAAWLNQKRKYKTKGTLTPEEIALLDKLNFDWKNFEDDWNKNFAVAESYFKEHNHLDVSKKDDPELYKWVANQRARFKKGSIKPERKVLLDSIGMIWDLLEYRILEGYKYAKKYFLEFGNLEVPKDYVFLENPEFDFSKWCIEMQKMRFRMTKEQIELLDSINFNWGPSYNNWQKNINKYQEEKMSGEPLSPEILKWQKSTLEQLKKHQLSVKQVEMLYTFGIITDIEYTNYISEEESVNVPKL